LTSLGRLYWRCEFVRIRSVTKGTFYLASYWSGVTETSHVALPKYALQARQLWLK
jgi:hypothetical protein